MCERDAAKTVQIVFETGLTPRVRRKKRQWQHTLIILLETYRQNINRKHSNRQTPIPVDYELKATPRARRRWERERGIKWVRDNHQMVKLQIEWAHEDQETYSHFVTPEAAKRGLSAAKIAFQTPARCSNPNCCGNPRRGAWGEPKQTRQERNHARRFKEELKDFKDREYLDEADNDYWMHTTRPMELWSGNHPDLTDDWDWDRTDFNIMRKHLNG
jgi:hypothetical protein